MITYHREIKLGKTKKKYDFRDLTAQLGKIVKASKIKNGLLNVQSLHTSAGVFINENEPLLLKDLQANWSRIFSPQAAYNHDNFKIRTVNMCAGECQNGHSHVNAVLLGSDVAVNIVAGKLKLGRWQRIFFVELDRARPRALSVMALGE
jgi:secondary thiamine-phosphate synthase enzyme